MIMNGSAKLPCGSCYCGGIPIAIGRSTSGLHHRRSRLFMHGSFNGLVYAIACIILELTGLTQEYAK